MKILQSVLFFSIVFFSCSNNDSNTESQPKTKGELIEKAKPKAKPIKDWSAVDALVSAKINAFAKESLKEDKILVCSFKRDQDSKVKMDFIEVSNRLFLACLSKTQHQISLETGQNPVLFLTQSDFDEVASKAGSTPESADGCFSMLLDLEAKNVVSSGDCG